ncbi:MAG TPA: TetR/AcrR family transcriptional regulator [Candidatus Binataceae bacterium]
MSVKSRSRQAENSAATRAALLRIARKLFAERGYAETATEEVVRRARVTRGALYHHFRDKQDLFEAVLDQVETKLVAEVTAVASRERDPWSALKSGCSAFLDACLDPAVQRIALIDAPAVLGWEKWREIDAKYFLSGVKAALQAAMDQNLIPLQPVEPLAHVLSAALNEASMLIAHAKDAEKARTEVSNVVERLLEGVRAKGR